MRILELRFKNLNSLYGEWFIDFTDAEFISNGIFALTGPTGAGKSTILDAICLALYGTTPRLGKITKSGNEIMSRQTGECFSEVVFESQAGRFRCHWAQHRARKNADADLQAPRHEIAEADQNGRVLEHQIRRVAEVIEEKTGMDFDRFTRSILLAQGGFDTFLKADVEQKSKLLEQITGTEVYSEISRRVHERQRDEHEKLNLILAETAGIVILEPQQEEEIGSALQEKQKQETDLAGRSSETAKAIVWLSAIDDLKNEISALSQEDLQLQAELETFKPQRERLTRSARADNLAGSYATLTTTRKQQSEDQAALVTEQANFPELEATVIKQTASLKFKEQQTITAKQTLKSAAPLIKKIRALDQDIDALKMAVSKAEELCKKDAVKIESAQHSALENQKKQFEARKNLELTQNYLKAHAKDEWLISGLAGVEAQLSNLYSRQKEIARKKIDEERSKKILDQAIQNMDSCTWQCGTRKQELEDAIKRLQYGKAELNELLDGRLLREYRNEKDSCLREKAFVSKIAELEDHRVQLQDGKPCPLCGAKEHPFARGNVPVADVFEKRIGVLTELISKVEDQEVAILELEKAETSNRKNLTESEKLAVAAANDKKHAEKAVSDMTNSLRVTRADFTNLKQELLSKLKPLGIQEIPDSEVSSLPESLQQRLQMWQNQFGKKTDIERQIFELGSELKRLNAVIETQSNTLAENQQNLDALNRGFSEGVVERRALYGGKSPDAEESRLSKAIGDHEQAEIRVRSLSEALRQKLTATKTSIDSLKKGIKKRENELKKLETGFTEVLGPAGFADENQFIQSRLTAEERDTLTLKAKELDDGQTDLKARQKDRETRLTTEVARKLTDATLEVLEPKSQELEIALIQLRDDIAGLKHRITENKAAKERIKAKQAAIDAQKQECQRWERLHGLIGSADGKKFRNFAQGLTFDLMVSHANRQLEKMSDRYLLIRDDKAPLELNVVDNYQAGEIRSTRNLSGGESFIVSLTLALGLSKMASQKVRVDSLFLDEGFGTLDEDALETALETLSHLQQENKLIGVISHVPALKERISTQIQVSPGTGGKSQLSGPGCTSVV